MNTLPSSAGGLPGPEQPTAEEVAALVVAAAVWAPSVHNTQPWGFSARGQEVNLYADASRQLMVADPGGREMMISCGAALFTARLALRSLGYVPDTCVLPDPAQRLLVARVSWQRRADPAGYEQQLFRWVRQRRTHRGGFAPLPLAPELLTVLQQGAERDGALLRIITGEGRRAALAAVATCGVAAALHSQPLELPWLREYICAHWSDGTYPQLLLRLGTVTQATASVRRPSASVLSPGGEPPGAGHE
jgi:hypothetical protein